MRRRGATALLLGGALAASCKTAPPPAPPAPTPPPLVAPLTDDSLRIASDAVQGGLVYGTAPPGTQRLMLDETVVRMAADGRFVIGFGRDAAPSATLRALLPTGQTIVRNMLVARRDWPTEVLSTLPRRAQPTEEFLRLRAGELRQIEAARATDSGSAGWRQRFVWPVTGRVSGRFGSQRIYKGGERGDYHSGVDVARPEGTPIAAPADGVVILAADAPFTLEGKLLMIDHGMGLNSAFLHLSRIDVKRGDRVRQGQTLGAIGMTGRATGPHLHWGIKWQDQRIDPQPLVGAMPGAVPGS